MALETAFLVLHSTFDSEGFVASAEAKNALEGKYVPGKVRQDKMIKVHFNPTELDFSMEGSKSREEKVSVNPGKDDKMAHAPAQEQIQQPRLKIPLIFDNSLSAKRNVQNVVEGFLTMIEDFSVRRIDFSWGMLFYKGILESVSAEYQLFDALGNPLRAKVDLDLKII